MMETDSPNLRVVIAGGGTGGHVYPGLAIAEALVRLRPGAEIVFVGGAGLERRLVPQAGWRFVQVAARQWPRRPSLRLFAAVAATVLGTAQSLTFLRRFRPGAVVATGGYAAAPVGAAAAILRIPLIVQEQNLSPGAANQILARWARAVSVPDESTAGRFGRKAMVTGVPIRAAAVGGDPARARRRFGLEDGRMTVLVLGGSQGAQSLNRAVVDAAALVDGVQILHQTGKDHDERVRRETARLGGGARHVALAYIEAMADAYACADLVVCRAGASTLAEATANGRAAIIVPYPFATGGHQDANARRLEAAGAAIVVPDRELSGRRLAGAITALRADPARLAAMAAASRRIGRPEAGDAVAALIVAAVQVPQNAPQAGHRTRRTAGGRD